MTTLGILLAIVLIVVFYSYGKRYGRAVANRKGAGPGTWIEFRKDITFHSPSTGKETLPPGTQALITSMGKGNGGWRYSIWIAEPWTKFVSNKTVPAFHNLEDFTAFRICSPWSVDEKVHADTMQAMTEWVRWRMEFEGEVFPPGWRELRRFLGY